MNIEEMITTPCSILKILPEKEKRDIAYTVARYYQQKGFPYYDLSMDEQKHILQKLIDFDTSTLELPNDELQQNMRGLNLANMYHPQMWEVQCGNARTPMEVFNDTVLLSNAIYKRIQYSDTKLQPFNIRKSLKVFGAYSVSNFRPTIAKYIYDNYCPKEGKVLDPCMGYGGRLLGAFSSKNVSLYLGVDPCEKQIKGNYKLSNLFVNRRDFQFGFVHKPFEDCEPHMKFDLVFTSPPYFDKELYSFEDTQSYIAYPTFPEWVDGFLFPLFRIGYDSLNSGGFFAINVGGKQLIEIALQLGHTFFGELVTTKHMRLSKVIGTKNGTSHKTEPIFIWRKE